MFDDPYDDLLPYYDSENADLSDDFPAYLHLAEEQDGPILDIGCGTGRVAFFLAAQAFKITGIDRSEAMLGKAKTRSVHMPHGDQIVWHYADMRALALESRFRLAIFSYNGFMHLLEQDEQFALLDNIHKHLNSGGKLALDLINPLHFVQSDDLPGLSVERIFTDSATDEQVIQQSLTRVDRVSQIVDITWIYDRIRIDRSVHREIIPVQLRYSFPSELRLLLQEAGFSEIELYGDYDFTPYQEGSPRLFIVATQ